MNKPSLRSLFANLRIGMLGHKKLWLLLRQQLPVRNPRRSQKSGIVVIPIRTRGNASTSREPKMREQDNRMTGIGDGNGEVLYIHRTPTLDRCLDELRRKGGVPVTGCPKSG